MKNLWKSLLVGVSINLAAHAEIIPIEQIKDLEAKVQELLVNHKAENILVGFDVTMTITHPQEAAAFYHNIVKYKDIYKDLMAPLSKESKDKVLTAIQVNPPVLVEPNTPEIIKSLQDKKVKTIAITAVLSGVLNEGGEASQNIVYNQLNDLGVDFENSFNTSEIIFTEVDEYNSNHPVFYKGILVTNGEGNINGKGEVLVSFMKSNNFSPEVIVMIDDKLKNLENMEAALKAYNANIKFVGLEYKKSTTLPAPNISAEDFKKFWQDLINKYKQ